MSISISKNKLKKNFSNVNILSNKISCVKVKEEPKGFFYFLNVMQLLSKFLLKVKKRRKNLHLTGEDFLRFFTFLIPKKGVKGLFQVRSQKELLNSAEYKQKRAYKNRHDIRPLINALKFKFKFHQASKNFFTNCRVYFKYTGSNLYGTITNSLGEVAYSYRGGTFKDLRTRKEKTTIFIARFIGELIALRLMKTNASDIFFIPEINHIKSRILLKNLFKGFLAIKFFTLYKLFIKRKITRNGVRAKKTPRK